LGLVEQSRTSRRCTLEFIVYSLAFSVLKTELQQQLHTDKVELCVWNVASSKDENCQHLTSRVCAIAAMCKTPKNAAWTPRTVLQTRFDAVQPSSKY